MDSLEFKLPYLISPLWKNVFRERTPHHPTPSPITPINFLEESYQEVILGYLFPKALLISAIHQKLFLATNHNASLYWQNVLKVCQFVYI